MTRTTKGWGHSVARVALFLFSALCAAEMAARLMGFHNTPLYEKHDAFEYRTVPNQRGRVYLNDYTINSLGMRGDVPDTSGVVVWICGDSVINGGVYCDEDSLAVARVDEKLESALGCTVSTLNISQGSWGPGNSLGFVRHYADELGQPDAILLVLNGQDWRDEMTHCYKGNSNDMPGKGSRLGLLRVWRELVGDDGSCIASFVGKGNTRSPLQSWIDLSRNSGASLAVYLHPSAKEVRTQSWGEGALEIQNFFAPHEVEVYDGMKRMLETDYRDNIHVSNSGQKNLSKALSPAVFSMLLLDE